ncbi:MAG: hypothetical protein U0326_21225 [Polyangiales bacterium]
MSASDVWAQGHPISPISTGRVLVEVGGGSAAFALGFGLTYGLALAGFEGSSSAGTISIIVVGAVGTWFAVPGGITLTGNAMGGGGGYGWTMLGGWAGGFAGYLVGVPFQLADNDLSVVPMVTTAIGWITGGVVAYEISSANSARQTTEAPQWQARYFAPTLLPLADGRGLVLCGGGIF